MATPKYDRAAVKSYSEKIFERRQTLADAPILARLSTNFTKDLRPTPPKAKHRRKHKASIARFLNWFAYSRKYRIKDNELLERCPLVKCTAAKFQDERELLEHLYSCPLLQNGYYKCPHCEKEVKIRRFHGDSCPETHSCKERIVSAISPLTRLLSPRASKAQHPWEHTRNEMEIERKPLVHASPVLLMMHDPYCGGDFMSASLELDSRQAVGQPRMELGGQSRMELGDTSVLAELPDFGLVQQHCHTTIPACQNKSSYSPLFNHSSFPSMENSFRGQDFGHQTNPSELDSNADHQEQYMFPPAIAQNSCQSHEGLQGAPSVPSTPFHGRSGSTSSTGSSQSSGTMTTTSTMSDSSLVTPSSDSPHHPGSMDFYQPGSNNYTPYTPVKTWIGANPTENWPYRAIQPRQSLEYQAPVHEHGESIDIAPISASDPHGMSKTSWASRHISISYEDNEKVYGHFPIGNPFANLLPREQPAILLFPDLKTNTSKAQKPQNPYTCICGFEFSGKEPNKVSNLKRHQDTCSTMLNNVPPSKKFKCNFPGCDKGYTRSDNLLVHKRNKSHMSEVTLEVNESSFLDQLIDSSFEDADREFNNLNDNSFDDAVDMTFFHRDQV
ncbi:hypothetical protein HYFRA_00010006 [Hymenoscyphus fraxineus]|uniref:C2H2-type domain-containing protein n=1 Tax=Hymenoscyphus fraxineus TaxID=746836 RepID=A0A9N9KTD1_9HELO|nr:hypothetical protein HYFRA_00010006 [Hymenoscyphus fraxineus]